MRASVIVPVCGRLNFAQQAVKLFLNQTLFDIELVVVDDSHGPTESVIPQHEQIKYVLAPPHTKTGGKRDVGIACSKSENIVIWDDDDWHSRFRVSHQVNLLENGVPYVAYSPFPFFDTQTGAFWVPRPGSARHAFIFSGGAAYKRRVWADAGGYEDIDTGEDVAFYKKARQAGYRAHRVASADMFVVVRHQRQTWWMRKAFEDDLESWEQTEGPEEMLEDQFYRIHKEVLF